MKPRIDMDKVEAALKRAGQVAAEGSREARSGRFTATNAAKPAPGEAAAGARPALKKANRELG